MQEIKVITQPLKGRTLSLCSNDGLFDGTGTSVVVCAAEFPWPHLKIFDIDTFASIAQGLLDTGLTIETIQGMMGKLTSTKVVFKQTLDLQDPELLHISASGSLTEEAVVIYDQDGSIQVWDKRTAPTRIDDKSIGRIRVKSN